MVSGTVLFVGYIVTVAAIIAAYFYLTKKNSNNTNNNNNNAVNNNEERGRPPRGQRNRRQALPLDSDSDNDENDDGDDNDANDDDDDADDDDDDDADLPELDRNAPEYSGGRGARKYARDCIKREKKIKARQRRRRAGQLQGQAQGQMQIQERGERGERGGQGEQTNKSKKEEKRNEERRKREEEREAREKEEELSEQTRLAALRKKEEDEFEAWKGEIVLEEGGSAVDDSSSSSSSVDSFLSYIHSHRVVDVDLLGAAFNIRVSEAISRIRTLLADGQLTGILDERGKFVYITPEELLKVAEFIREKGRVSVEDVARAANRIIDLKDKTLQDAKQEEEEEVNNA